MSGYLGAALMAQRPVKAWKVCSLCGKEFSESEWNRLPNLGPPMVSEEDGWEYSVQLKNCDGRYCGTTLGHETRRRVKP